MHDDEFALIVTLSKMHNLELPALRGKTLFFFKVPINNVCRIIVGDGVFVTLIKVQQRLKLSQI